LFLVIKFYYLTLKELNKIYENNYKEIET